MRSVRSVKVEDGCGEGKGGHTVWGITSVCFIDVESCIYLRVDVGFQIRCGETDRERM